MSLRLVSGLHVQYSACTILGQWPGEPCLFSIYKKIYSTPGNQNKTGQLAKLGVKPRNCNEKWWPDPWPTPCQNWPIGQQLANVGARGHSGVRPRANLANHRATRRRHSSHTNNRIVAHPPHQVVQRVVQQSPQRLVETPLVEDLLDPNRPRNGLIDGRLALQVVVVQD